MTININTKTQEKMIDSNCLQNNKNIEKVNNKIMLS